MKDIKTYIIEAISHGRRSAKYGLEDSKESIVGWLDSNGFKRFDYGSYKPDSDPHINGNDKYTYLIHTPKTYKRHNDWISVHTPRIVEMVIWFLQDGTVDEIGIKRRSSVVYDEYVDFETFMSIIEKQI